MQLSSSRAQKPRQLEIRIDQLARESRNFRLFTRYASRSNHRRPCLSGRQFVEIPQGSLRIAPAISLIRHKSLQSRLHHVFTIVGAIFEPSPKRRHMTIPPSLRKKLPDLHLRIDSFFDSSEEFQDQLLAIDDRAVALLTG